MEPMRHTASIRDIRESQYGSGFFFGGLWVFWGAYRVFWGVRGGHTGPQDPPDPQDPPRKKMGGSQPHRIYGAHNLYTRHQRISRWRWGSGGGLGGVMGVFWGWGGHTGPQDPPSPTGPPRKKMGGGGHNPMEFMGRTASIRDTGESPDGGGGLWGIMGFLGGMGGVLGGWGGGQKWPQEPPDPQDPPGEKMGGSQPHGIYGAHSLYTRHRRISRWWGGGFWRGYGFFWGAYGCFLGVGGVTNGLRTPPQPPTHRTPLEIKWGVTTPWNLWGAQPLYETSENLQMVEEVFGGGLTGFFGGWGVRMGLRPPPHPKDPPRKKMGGSQPHGIYGRTASI